MRGRWQGLLGLVAALAAFAAPARAQRGLGVYLNDVKLEGGELRGQTLTGVDVRFDDNGDVHIVAKGYKVTSDAPPPPPAGTRPAKPAAPPALTKRYFIAASPQVHPGAAQWEIDVFVNQVFVKRYRSKDADPILEVTRQMRPGANVVHFTARKDPGERISTSPLDALELVIGDGDLNGGQLLLNRLASYRRTAAEIGGYNTDITIDLSAQ